MIYIFMVIFFTSVVFVVWISALSMNPLRHRITILLVGLFSQQVFGLHAGVRGQSTQHGADHSVIPLVGGPCF